MTSSLEDRAIEEEIDGVMYRVWPIPMKPHGTAALVKLIKLISPVLGGIFKAGTKAEMGAALFDSLPSVLSESDVDYFAKVFGDAASYLNDKGEWAPLIDKVQSQHFAGRYWAYFKWIALAARCNYAGFFDGMRSAVASGDPLGAMK